MSDAQALARSAATVRRLAGEDPFAVAVVLGSGLGALADQVEVAAVIPYGELPLLPSADVAGHAGRLVAGSLEGERLLLFQGRHHLYQGFTAHQASAPARLAHALGCRRLLLTNASGGVNETFRPGDFMLISDHLNFLGDNPLRGLGDDPFIDLCGLYQQDFFPDLLDFADRHGIGLHRGVLAAMAGPSYETPAEIRVLRLLGADAVSMSTVPEAIMARYLGLEVAGLSFIANAAAGLSAAPLRHEDVLASGRQSQEPFCLLTRALLRCWKA